MNRNGWVGLWVVHDYMLWPFATVPPTRQRYPLVCNGRNRDLVAVKMVQNWPLARREP